MNNTLCQKAVCEITTLLFGNLQFYANFLIPPVSSKSQKVLLRYDFSGTLGGSATAIPHFSKLKNFPEF